MVWCSLKIPMNDTNGMSASGAKRFEKSLGKYFMAPHGIQCSHRIQCCNIVHCDSFHILPPSQWGRWPLFETPDPGLRKEVSSPFASIGVEVMNWGVRDLCRFRFQFSKCDRVPSLLKRKGKKCSVLNCTFSAQKEKVSCLLPPFNLL